MTNFKISGKKQNALVFRKIEIRFGSPERIKFTHSFSKYFQILLIVRIASSNWEEGEIPTLTRAEISASIPNGISVRGSLDVPLSGGHFLSYSLIL